MKIHNFTPHVVAVFDEDGDPLVTFAPAGLARSKQTVITVGELVKNLTEECRLSHPEVAWKEIAGFRDIAAHKYQTLRMEDVYETAVTDFPDLQHKITKILESLEK